jgi:type VI secretion system secreted protein Hcp
MALDAYLRIIGSNQGMIRGDIDFPGREGFIRVIAVNHEITSPTERENTSGLPISRLKAGKCLHTPFIITKEVDRATPLLINALVNKENISEFELRFWQKSDIGEEVQYYTIHLMNAGILSIRFEMLNNKIPKYMPLKECEHISFRYHKIIWTYEDGSVRSEDNW